MNTRIADGLDGSKQGSYWLESTFSGAPVSEVCRFARGTLYKSAEVGTAYLSASSSAAFSLDLPEPKDTNDLKEPVLGRLGLM